MATRAKELQISWKRMNRERRNTVKELSVIIPIYNVPQALFAKCLDSLCCASAGLLEIIAVDDGSTEECSKAICEEISRHPSLSIQYFKKTNGGQNSARALGLQKATGRYIFFVDADDYVETDALDTVISILREKSPKILAFNYDVRKPDGSLIASHNHWARGLKEADVRNGLLRSGSLCLQIYNRNDLIACGINLIQGVRIGEDFASATALLAAIESEYALGMCVYHYVQRPGSIISKPPANSALDILHAFDLMMQAVGEAKLQKYSQEFEWLAILHVLYYGSYRIIIHFQCDKTYLDSISMWINKMYPNWMDNPYMQNSDFYRMPKFRMIISRHCYPVYLYHSIRDIAKTLLSPFRRKNHSVC